MTRTHPAFNIPKKSKVIKYLSSILNIKFSGDRFKKHEIPRILFQDFIDKLEAAVGAFYNNDLLWNLTDIL